MPVVPFTSRSAPAGLGQKGADLPPPPLDWALIAAAQMHAEGRLIDPKSRLPLSTNIEDRRGSNKPEGDHVDDAFEAAADQTRHSVLNRSASQP